MYKLIQSQQLTGISGTNKAKMKCFMDLSTTGPTPPCYKEYSQTTFSVNFDSKVHLYTQSQLFLQSGITKMASIS